MKIGIITFSYAVNYGAVLQAYGLKCALESLGHEVHVIDYCPEYFEYYHTPLRRPYYREIIRKGGLQKWLGYFKAKPRKRERSEKFRQFCKEHLNPDSKPLTTLHSDYDVYVCGSDQIWNPEICWGKLDEVYFGILPSGDVKTIAYAASVGSLDKLNGYEAEFAQALQSYSAISTRESNLAEYVNKIDSKHNAQHVVDPTLLAGSKPFEFLAQERIIEDPYLLFFDLFNDSELRDRAKKIAKEKNLAFKELTTYHDYVPGQKLLAPASPAEFCSYFRFADMVVTDSFHATAFSLMFHRPFFSFEWHTSKNDRITGLLKSVGLSHCFVKRGSTISEVPIDWNDVDLKLSALREGSLNFLIQSLTI